MTAAFAPNDFETGEISMGVGQTDSDTLSSKFEEYRDLPNGFVVRSFRFHGLKDGFHWDFSGQDVRARRAPSAICATMSSPPTRSW